MTQEQTGAPGPEMVTVALPTRVEDCLLCGHDYESHEWWRDVPMKYVPCPECPEGLCRDPD